MRQILDYPLSFLRNKGQNNAEEDMLSHAKISLIAFPLPHIKINLGKQAYPKAFDALGVA